MLACQAFDHLERCTLGGWYIDSIPSGAKRRSVGFVSLLRSELDDERSDGILGKQYHVRSR